ncbi:hypothetical protein NPIL_325401 [Nephila pilipes]|uniref:Uncharacterized protein n=1 Tax=Nephila pilipes TaxID=299642 RepID=A0A8X6T5V0_NEPPI|nr:hypothetical protein NPIL_325401 [Nephila pilipes]
MEIGLDHATQLKCRWSRHLCHERITRKWEEFDDSICKALVDATPEEDEEEYEKIEKYREKLVVARNRNCITLLKIHSIGWHKFKFHLRDWEFTGEVISLLDPKPTPVLGLLWGKSEVCFFVIITEWKCHQIQLLDVGFYANRVC